MSIDQDQEFDALHLTEEWLHNPRFSRYPNLKIKKLYASLVHIQNLYTIAKSGHGIKKLHFSTLKTTVHFVAIVF